MSGFNKLIVKALRINPEAAIYLAGKEIRKLDSFNKSGELDNVMIWDQTPQGHQYWWDINVKLMESKQKSDLF